MIIPSLRCSDTKLPMQILKDGRGESGSTTAILPIVLFAVLICIGSVMAAVQEKGKTYNPHGKLKISCTDCHTTESWKSIRPFPEFDHGTTRYPLKGTHKHLDCRQCHIKLAFSNVGMRCADCHADIHHRQMGADCEQCHSERGWRAVARSLNGHKNRLPLMGAHAAVECEACHTSAAVGLFRGLRSDCAFCHINDYNTAQTINHKQSGFSTNCQDCHSFDGWIRGLNHASFTGFALTGAHARLDCFKCHLGGIFTGAPTDCYSCHSAQYNGTTDPNHVALQFSHDCSQCHTTASWSGAAFSHSQFPIFSGTHARVWTTCGDCHTNSSNYAVFTCINCHTHDQTSTNARHNGVRNYLYNATSCYSCHPNGNAG
jgi:hypothetical protein